MKHKLLTTATLLLFVLLTGSCTNEEELVMTPPAITTPDASALSITIGPRPQFAIGNTLPATRAIQTPEATQWEEKDVLWLYVHFSWIPEGKTKADKVYKNYVSALRYNGTEWRQLSEEDCTELNTAGITPYIATSPDEISYLGFVSNPRWPSEALAVGVTDAKITVKAYFLGNEKHEEGIIDFGGYNTKLDVDFMEGSSTSLTPGQPVSINLAHKYARLYVPDTSIIFLGKIPIIPFDLNKGKEDGETILLSLSTLYPYKGPIYLVNITEDSYFTLNNIPYNLTPGIDSKGNPSYAGYAYTLVPLNNGEVTPGDL